jgi:hypothetical protein
VQQLRDGDGADPERFFFPAGRYGGEKLLVALDAMISLLSKITPMRRRECPSLT